VTTCEIRLIIITGEKHFAVVNNASLRQFASNSPEQLFP
jgi:hypothetical protein